jgi:cell division protein FtsA
LSGIIQARMEEIIDAALFVINTSGYAKKLGAGIVVTGGGSLLENLPQLLSFKIGIESKIGTPINFVNYTNHTEFNNPIFSTGVGLLIHASSTHNYTEEVEMEAVSEMDEQAEKNSKKGIQFKKQTSNKLIEKLTSIFKEGYTDTKL